MKLNNKDFLEVIKNTPLLSIDLIVKNPGGQVLLGLRNNLPARNSWFVPGGRVFKNERIHDAVVRIAVQEIGVAITITEVEFVGVFEHFYEENFAGKPGIDTHYVVLAVQLFLTTDQKAVPDEQHKNLKYWQISDLLASKDVHDFTKAYFLDPPPTSVFVA